MNLIFLASLVVLKSILATLVVCTCPYLHQYPLGLQCRVSCIGTSSVTPNLLDEWPGIHSIIISKILSWVKKEGLSGSEGPNTGDKNSTQILCNKVLCVYLSHSSNIIRMYSEVMAICGPGAVGLPTVIAG